MLETLMAELSGPDMQVAPLVSAIRLGAAAVLAAAIGLEREILEKPAGLRTHILISVAAAMFAVMSVGLPAMFESGPESLRVDPLRLIEAVTAGVAFLAAGVIFTSGGNVKNITTGASMWLAGAIGLACGAGQLPLAAMGAVLVVCVLIVLRRVEKRLGTEERRKG